MYVLFSLYRTQLVAQKTGAKPPSKKRVKLKLTKAPLPKKLKTSSNVKQESVQEAFEQPSQPLRKIEINLTDAITSIFDGGPPQLETPRQEQVPVVEGFGKFEPRPEEQDNDGEDESEVEESDEFISLKELDANRMTTEGTIHIEHNRARFCIYEVLYSLHFIFYLLVI